MPYVLDVPPGPEQEETVADIRQVALDIRPNATLHAFKGPGGVSRLVIVCSDEDDERAVAFCLKMAFVPFRASIKGGRTP